MKYLRVVLLHGFTHKMFEETQTNSINRWRYPLHTLSFTHKANRSYTEENTSKNMCSMDNLQDLLNSCLLPELKQDLDTIPIEKEHFKSYHDCLQIQLPLLYDWIQQDATQWMFAVEGNDRIQHEIQSSMVILLCELSSPNYLFHIDIPELISNCDRVLWQYSVLSQEVEQLVFQYYQEKLHKDTWKRQMGAIHGLIKYLEFKCEHSSTIVKKMSQQFLMFCLSVGLNVRTCYETHYKYLSTCIFSILLEHGSNDDIVSMNIHGVIYDAVFKDLHVMDSIPFIEKQWNCLLKCFDFFTDIDSFTWNKLDDSLEVLLRHIPLAPNSQSSVSLMQFVSKYVVYFNINRQEYVDKLSQDLTQNGVINECRQLGTANTSYTSFRWAKTILQMFILESYRLMQSTQICKELLMEIHRCYMVTILPIGLTILESQLIIFFEKFTAILMEVAKVQNYKEDIMQVITSMLESFCYQLQICDNTHKLFKFKEAYHNLLQIDTFKRYTTPI